jgi:clan AA aspartic protease (TIGR02281 family)
MRFGSGAPVVAPVLINGVALRLMVDTGADRTVISPAAAARTGLPLDGGRGLRVLGVAGSALADEIVVNQMEVAGARVGPIRALVLDTPVESLDGLLGRDVLDFFTLTVDSNAGRATLIPR